ncbi:unnamed protein product [Soboliphyme baturini]|uniref:Protein unc-50 homolog n=1 Tax=Soboliphyme baturini TaxID=241478 RepID=A0A183IZ49_9BILA|nr:unnamed protein product [Soboliphyme baturini]
MRRVFDQDVEWGYCFDVHLNALFPVLMLLHVFLPCFYPNQSCLKFFFLVIRSIGFFSCFVCNTTWLVAVSYYIYITFLGYLVLPFLKNAHIFLYPFTFLFIFYVGTLSLSWNVMDAFLTFYKYRFSY